MMDSKKLACSGAARIPHHTDTAAQAQPYKRCTKRPPRQMSVQRWRWRMGNKADFLAPNTTLCVSPANCRTWPFVVGRTPFQLPVR